MKKALRLATVLRRPVHLTPTERKIVRHVAQGLSSRAIADHLGTSIKTVEAHRANVHRKLGIGKAALLVRWAIEEGIA